MTLSNVALKDAPEYRSKRENIYLLLVMVKYSLQKFIREFKSGRDCCHDGPS